MCSDDLQVPHKVFDRDSNVYNSNNTNNDTSSNTSSLPNTPPRVVNYQVSESGKWFLLVTLTYSSSGEFIGEMQLYSVEKQISQLLSGRNGVFTSMVLSNRDREEPVEVLCFEHKDPEGVCML
jgi:hypothetical protein